jgi:hypothetical protein
VSLGIFRHYANLLKLPQWYHKVKLFYLEGFVSKLMDKNTSLLTRNTAFEHKFHFDRRKWKKKKKWRPDYHNFCPKTSTLFGQKQLDFEENIEETV